MRKLLVSIMLGVITMIITGCSNEIDLVKDGTMSFDKSLTIGEAFDNWSNCINQDWKIIETDNGKIVVQFTGEQVIDDEQFENLERIDTLVNEWLALETKKEDLHVEDVKKIEDAWEKVERYKGLVERAEKDIAEHKKKEREIKEEIYNSYIWDIKRSLPRNKDNVKHYIDSIKKSKYPELTELKKMRAKIDPLNQEQLVIHEELMTIFKTMLYSNRFTKYDNRKFSYECRIIGSTDVKISYIAQWTINKDSTFDLSYMGEESHIENQLVSSQSLTHSFLKDVYSNKIYTGRKEDLGSLMNIYITFNKNKK